MSIFIYYHITCLNNWKEIVREQLTRVIFSGLYDKLKEIRCYAIIPYNNNEKDNEDEFLNKETECLRIYLSTFGKKVLLLDTCCKGYESFTINNIPSAINDDDIVFYFHTKGVTRYKSTTYMLNGIYEYTIPDLEQNIQYWKDCLDYVLIKKHEKCISLLKDEKRFTVGVNAIRHPYHYSGHYWWACGTYLKSLQPVQDTTIVNIEPWLLSNMSLNREKHVSLLNNFHLYGYYYSEPLSELVDL